MLSIERLIGRLKLIFQRPGALVSIVVANAPPTTHAPPSSPPSAPSTAQDSSPSHAIQTPSPSLYRSPSLPPHPNLRECSDSARLCPRPYVNLACTSPVGGASSDLARRHRAQEGYTATERGKADPPTRGAPSSLPPRSSSPSSAPSSQEYTHRYLPRYLNGYGPERGYTTSSPDSSSGSGVDIDVDAVDAPFECKDEPEVDFCSGSRSSATNSDTSDANDPEPARAHGLDEEAASHASWAPSLSFPQPSPSPPPSSASSSSSRKDETTPTPQCESLVKIFPAVGGVDAEHGTAARSRSRSRSCSWLRSRSWLAEGPCASEVEVEMERGGHRRRTPKTPAPTQHRRRRHVAAKSSTSQTHIQTPTQPTNLLRISVSRAPLLRCWCVGVDGDVGRREVDAGGGEDARVRGVCMRWA
ncbi:hypothetical protein B0H13DRAFT_2348886 [Mycena leptocephala]|nr:hypothetical protein B0H13DRAFT_2348886 [Mycena leptocephala]